MAKLKQRDKRPKRRFKIGDLVEPHPSRTDLKTVGTGIVVQSVSPDADIIRNNFQVSADLGDTQFLKVFFAPREVDLCIEAQRIARSIVDEPDYAPHGMILTNIDLMLVESDPGWLNPPGYRELSMLRFSDIAEDLDW